MIQLRPYQSAAIEGLLPRRVEDIAGMRSGSLLAVRYLNSTAKGKARWLCRCDCGAEKPITAESLKRGKSKSCGCKSSDFKREKMTTHGQSRTPRQRPTGAFSSWAAMRQRCNNPNNAQFSDYGGRGISVCARWGRFDNFFADMGDRPEGNTLDRIDPNAGYSPENCRWATPSEQTRNRRKKVRNAEVVELLDAARFVVSNPTPDAIAALADAISTFEHRRQ